MEALKLIIEFLLVLGVLSGFAFIVVKFSGRKDIVEQIRSIDPEELYQNLKETGVISKYYHERLLTETEAAALRAIQELCKERNEYVFTQVSLKKILGHHDQQSRNDIDSKYVDFLLTDHDFIPVFAIEVFESGRFNRKSTEQPDDIKRLALIEAGIGYLTITTNKKEAYNDIYTALSTTFEEESRITELLSDIEDR